MVAEGRPSAASCFTTSSRGIFSALSTTTHTGPKDSAGTAHCCSSPCSTFLRGSGTGGAGGASAPGAGGARRAAPPWAALRRRAHDKRHASTPTSAALAGGRSGAAAASQRPGGAGLPSAAQPPRTPKPLRTCWRP